MIEVAQGDLLEGEARVREGCPSLHPGALDLAGEPLLPAEAVADELRVEAGAPGGVLRARAVIPLLRELVERSLDELPDGAIGIPLPFLGNRGASRGRAGSGGRAGNGPPAEAIRATVIGPVCFRENLLDLDFNGLRRAVSSLPLPGELELDRVTVLDTTGMAVYATEHPEKTSGRAVDIAADRVSGERAPTLAGDQIAAMFEGFERAPRHLDIAALRADYPEVGWHTFEEGARTMDWRRRVGG